MLKRTSQILRSAAEATGLAAPNLPDAQSAAETRQRDLIAATTATSNAETALQALHDRAAPTVEILAAEALLDDAKLKAERARRAYVAAARRLKVVADAEQAAKQSATRKLLDAALAVRLAAAVRIDELAVEVAAEVKKINDQDELIMRAMRDKVCTDDGATFLGSAKRAAAMAMSRVGVTDRIFLGDPTLAPGAQDIIESGNGCFALAPVVYEDLEKVAA